MPDLLLILIVILIIVLLARGPQVLPQIGTGLGQMIKGFREAVKDPNEAKSSQNDPGRPGPTDPGSGASGAGGPSSAG